MDEFQLAGLTLAKIILAACSFGSAIFVGVKIGERSNKWWGWASGILTFAIFGMLLASASSAIDDKICAIDHLASECD
jgi:hypothetical protein